MTASEYIKANLPVSRFFRVASKVVDPEDDLAFKYIDAISGIRQFKFDKLKGQLDTIRRQKLQTGKFRTIDRIVGVRREFKGDSEVERLNNKTAEILKKIRSR